MRLGLGLSLMSRSGQAAGATAGSSAGVAAVSGIGAAFFAAAAASAGVASVTGVGQEFESGISAAAGSSAGVATASAVGTATTEAAGSSAGVATVSGVGDVDPEATNLTATVVDETSASVTMDVNKGDGNIYAVAINKATGTFPPSVAQVKAGQDGAGAAAAWDHNQGVSTSGTQTFAGGATGLTEGQTYALYGVYTDGDLNDSDLATGNDFTPADVTAPVIQSLDLAKVGPDDWDGTVNTDTAEGELDVVITTSSTAPSKAQIKAGQDHTGSAAADSVLNQAVAATGVQNLAGNAVLSGSTEYWGYAVHTDAEGNESDVLSVAASFTTDAAQVPDAFVDADWSVATGSGGSELDVTIAALPDANGAAITNVQYDVDAGGVWTSLPAYAGTGVYTITMAAPATSYAIRLRAVNSAGNAAAGNSESATSGSASDTYAVNGKSPDLVADFVAEFYRKEGSTSTFGNVLNFTRTGTATYFNSSGNLVTAADGNARVGHYKYNGSSWVDKGLLLETEARTNKFINSEDLTAVSWTVTNTTITSNQANGPDGVASLDKIEISSSITGDFKIVDDTTDIITINTDYCLSCFVRNGDNQFVDLWAYASNGGDHHVAVTFDLVNGTKTQEDPGSGATLKDAGIIDYGGGLYRLYMVFRVGSTVGTEQCGLALVDSGTPTHDTVGLRSYAGTAGDHVFAGFFQMEVGRTPSSYIPTAGSEVTRNAEALTSPAANHSPSTTALSLQMNGEITYIDEGSAAQQTFLRWQSDASNYISWDLDTDGAFTGEVNANQAQSGTVDTVVATAEYSPGVGVAFNIASRHENDEINVAKDGAAETADTTPIALVDLSAVDLEIGQDFMGTIDTLRLWQTVGLTNAELVTATS